MSPADPLAARRQVEARVLRDWADVLEHAAAAENATGLGLEVVREAARSARDMAKTLGPRNSMTLRGLAAEYRLAEQADDSDAPA